MVRAILAFPGQGNRLAWKHTALTNIVPKWKIGCNPPDSIRESVHTISSGRKARNYISRNSAVDSWPTRQMIVLPISTTA